MNPRYSLIVPAYNEEERIVPTLEENAAIFADSEVIVVLNGCTDDTRGKVESVKRRYPNVQYIDIDHAVGKGGAIRAGFLAARATVIGFVDADGSTPPREARRLFDELGTADGIIGSRWLPASKVCEAQPLRRRLASRAFNALIRLLFGLRFRDTQCGAKIFRRTALETVLPFVETANMAFDVDLLVSMQRHGFRVVEMPTEWNDMSGSKVRLLATASKMLAAILRLRLHGSILRLAIPLFDRLFPTAPIKVHDGISILILNWRDPRHPQAGGAEAYLFEMAKYWVQSGNHVEWLTAGFKGSVASETIDGIKITRVGNRFTVYLAVPIAYLRRFRDRFDVLIDSENGIPFFSPLFSLKPKVCVMHHVHQRVFRAHLPFPISEFFAWIERAVMPSVYARAHFVAVSNDTRDEMQGLGTFRRAIDVVHNGVDPALAPGTKSSQPTVVYFGRLRPYKRVHLLLEAFSRVRQTVPDAKLVIAGSGDAERQLRSLASDLGIEPSIIFEGYVTETRKRRLLQEAWVLVNPSSMEGWGISVIEANACGTPALAFRVPGLREAIRDGVTGLLVDDGADLSVALATVFIDKPLREALSKNAIRYASQFSWKRSAEAMYDVMLRTISGDSFSLVRENGHWAVVSGSKHAASKIPIVTSGAVDRALSPNLASQLAE